MNPREKKIAVIGAGVVGLSTALCILEKDPSFKVTIFADKIEDDTLSSGAGGLFRPSLSAHPDQNKAKKWCKDSLNHFFDILNKDEASSAGMQLVTGYQLFSTVDPIYSNLLAELLPDYRVMNEDELRLFPAKFRSGIVFTTIVADCRYYLPWMMKKFKSNGGNFVEKYITDLSEIPEDFSITVNCTGLGAGKLIPDEYLSPIRGQVIKVKAPWIKHFYYGDRAYVVPGVDYVTLGGIYDFGNWSTAVNEQQKEYIWKECTELVPSLKNAEFAWDWVGLRPYRTTVRVDSCLVGNGTNYRIVVNNYGHGANGVSLSHGTAVEAADIVKNLLDSKNISLAKL